MKKLLSFAALSLMTAVTSVKAADSVSEMFTVEKLNELNQLHDVTLSPQGDVLVYGLKKGSSSKDNHLYLSLIHI